MSGFLPLPALVAVVATGVGARASPRAAAGPVSTSGPTVAGTAEQGSRLTVSPGGWVGVGRIRYAYAWYRCTTMGARGTRLHGVARGTPLLGAGDVGHTLSVAVRATDSAGTSTAYSSL